MHYHVYVLLTLITYTKTQQVIPFCSYCECNFESQDGVNLDCTNTDMKGILLDSYFWYDNYNASYRVATLIAQNSNLQTLEQPFPSSTLKILNLRGNGISRIVDGAFSNLQNLIQLDLSNNSLEYLKPDVFKGMYFMGNYYPLNGLKLLKLNHNKLKVLHQNTFDHIQQIEQLDLSYNPLGAEISSSTQNALKSLKNLQQLNLAGCSLEKLPDELFSERFRGLETLDLSENLFLHIPKALQNLKSLECLYLNENPFLELRSTSVFPEQLKTLHLNYLPNLEIIHAHALSNLKYLDEFYLHDNPFLSEIHERAFYTQNETDDGIELPQLRVFDVHNCNLTRLSSELLPYWKTLDYLNISGNPWVCDCHNQIFIETVALTNIDAAENVFCDGGGLKSFFQVKEEGVVLPCPMLDASFTNFRSVLVLVVLINILAIFTCCLFRKRFRRVVLLRNIK